jgi:hypothetical protein
MKSPETQHVQVIIYKQINHELPVVFRQSNARPAAAVRGLTDKLLAKCCISNTNFLSTMH